MFNVKSVEDEKELAMLREFLLQQGQFYPNYDSWVDGKCIPRVDSGEYHNIIAISGGRVVGDAVYREGEEGIEIKNFRIDPEYRRRALGHFLMSQVEHQNPGSRLHLDVTVNNFLGVEFFIRNGFHITDVQDLYVEGQGEYLLEKFSRTPKIQASLSLQ